MLRLRGQGSTDARRGLGIHPGNQHVLGLFRKAAGDGHNLVGRFPFTENHLGDTVTEGAVMIDLGESQILKRHMPQLMHGGVDINCPILDFLEQRAQAFLIH